MKGKHSYFDIRTIQIEITQCLLDKPIESTLGYVLKPFDALKHSCTCVFEKNES